MDSYFAFGLHIASELPLPELAVTTAKPDIYIRVGSIDLPSLQSDYGPETYVGETEFGRLLVSKGCELVFDPIAGLDEAVLRQLILGPALALLLRQRGLLTLHASCVAIESEAVAFVGNTGWGKSTIAKAFHGRGYPLVTDDLLAIDFRDGNANIVPSFPLIKLWPDSAVALESNLSQFSRLYPATDKLLQYLDQGFQNNKTPLRQIYVLWKGDEPGIHSLTAQDAFAYIVAHSWGAENFSERHLRETHLRQCVMLINQVPISRLERPKDLQLLPQILDMVMADLAKHEYVVN